MTAATEALAGRRILLTRSEEDCAEWAERLAQHGAEAVVLPCIRTETIDTRELRAELERALANADWLVFTSRRGVEAFEQLRGSSVRPSARVAVVGAATADAARAKLGRVDLVGRGTGAVLAAELAARGDIRDSNVVIAVAANASDAVEKTLAAAGARCTRLDLYRTIPAPPATVKRRLSALRAERVVLASPSAARGFVHQVELDVPAAIYTIGPSTTAAARALGLDVAAEAREPSLEGILEAMQ